MQSQVPSESSSEYVSTNIFCCIKLKVLVASDLHVGYAEKNPKIGMDSYRTLEEVLQIALNNNVDFILLGGDLFHYNSPSRLCTHRVIRVLRQYCFNDRPVYIQFLSDPTVNFSHSAFSCVNYEDMNINAGLPIFTVHGNHDAPFGGGYTALDTLHECGLINLFGRFDSIDNFEVVPILLQKGKTKLALYGIGHQRDDRICRAFREEKIRFLRPQEDTDSWFNILVVHQNRPRRSTDRSTGAHLPENLIPSFFDLVIWGHEHECKIEPQYYENNPDIHGDGFYIMQPGSTIVTSLSQEESRPKHVFVITINERSFISTPLRLQTARPFLFDNLIIDHIPPQGCSKHHRLERNMPDEKAVIEKIEKMLKQHASNEENQELLPLLRLRVHYPESWEDVKKLDNRSIWNHFTKSVVNVSDMIVIKTSSKVKGKKHNAELLRHIEKATTVEEIIEGHFNDVSKSCRLMVLSSSLLNDHMKHQNENEHKRNVKQDLLDCIRGEKERFVNALCKGSYGIEDMDISDKKNLYHEIEEKLTAEVEKARELR